MFQSEELPISASLSLKHLSFLCRREEESTDHEGGTVCRRKWPEKINIILREIMSNNGRKLHILQIVFNPNTASTVTPTCQNFPFL